MPSQLGRECLLHEDDESAQTGRALLVRVPGGGDGEPSQAFAESALIYTVLFFRRKLAMCTRGEIGIFSRHCNRMITWSKYAARDSVSFVVGLVRERKA